MDAQTGNLLLAILPFVGLAVFLAVYSVFSLNRELVSEATETEADEDAKKEGLLLRLSLTYVRALGAIISRTRFAPGFRKSIAKKLLAAGRADVLTADEFLGTMILGVITGAAFGTIFAFLLEGYFELIIPALGMLGLFMPYMGLSDKIRKRHRAIRRQLPFALDLLTLSVESGLEFTASLSKIAARMKKGPLKTEVQRLGREIAMGKTRSEALRAMSDRVQLEDLSNVVSALVQADELGSALGPTLRIQAEDLRRKRFQLAEKKAQQAPVLMLFPLVAFIFPLTFIITFAPLVIKMMYENPFGDLVQ